MRGTSLFKWVFIPALLVMVLFLSLSNAHADQLYQVGMVKSFSPGTVVIDVQSRSCRGTWTFTVDRGVDLSAFVGRQLDFLIDGGTCIKGLTYKIILPQKGRR
jgi:hypothetical protein